MTASSLAQLRAWQTAVAGFAPGQRLTTQQRAECLACLAVAVRHGLSPDVALELARRVLGS